MHDLQKTQDNRDDDPHYNLKQSTASIFFCFHSPILISPKVSFINVEAQQTVKMGGNENQIL